MDDIFAYIITLPPKTREIVVPCADGYTVYIADWLDEAGRKRAYDHAVEHIKNGDFDSENRDADVQTIEGRAHGFIRPKKKKTVSKYEKYIRKLKKRKKVFEAYGYYIDEKLVDDEYGSPKVISVLKK